MTVIKTLYFDESGYTGTDLLNTDQPLFCVVSSDIEEGVAKEILKKSFPNYKGEEFKFNNIWRKPTNRERLTIFVKEISNNKERLFAHINDKKFVILTKIVDFLIEPVSTNAGYDFYADGFNRKLTNMFHFGLILFAPKNLYEDLVKLYSKFSRYPTEESLNHLQVRLREMKDSSPEELLPYLGMASLGADNFLQNSNIVTFKNSNEIQLTVVLASVAYWRTKSDLDFSIIHDQSSNFFKQLEMWEKITNPNVPKQIIIDGQGDPVQYPLRVVSTEEGDSKKYWAIQLCDMVAGLILRMFTPKNTPDEQEFMQKLFSEGIDQIPSNGIRPEQDFVDGAPKESDGPDAVDQFTNIIFGK
jgi:hypothetical protein